MNAGVKKLTTMAMLAAMSIVLVYLIRFPIFPVAPYLEYEPADVPIIVGTLLFGPWSGLALTVIVSFIQGFTVSSGSQIIGVLMHIFATGSLVLVLGMIQRKGRPSKARTVVSLISGVCTMTLTMVVWNVIFTPLFLHTPVEAVLSILVPVIIPFNLIKGGVNTFVAFVVFKSVEKAVGIHAALR